MHCRWRWTIIALALTLLSSESAVSALELPQSGVVILVDTSGSFGPLDKHQIQGIRSIARAVEKLAVEEWITPVALFWATIDSTSVKSNPPCGPAVLYKPALIKGRIADVIESRKELHAWFDACLEVFSNNKATPDSYTDIGGAIAMATATLQGAKDLNAIIIVSDFEEDLPIGTEATPFTFRDEHVVMVYGPSRKDSAQPKQMFQRIAEWKQRFRAAHAKSVCDIPLKGLLLSHIIACFQEKGGRS